jgi:methylamine--corrinoid protein Co-methyltransferase
MSIQKFVKVLDKAHSGPVVSVKEWDTQRVPKIIKEKLEKFGLKGASKTGQFVNADDELADRFFQAGLEVALELGVLCQDTERVIQITESDVQSAFERAPQKLVLGKGKDKVTMRCRQPEDGVKPLFTAPLGIVVSEEYWVPLNQGIVMQKEVDILQGGSLNTVFGSPLKGGTPYETLSGRLQAQLHREALWRAGRPGMPATAVITSPTAYGQLGGFGIPGGFAADQNIAMVLAPAEMKTTYDALHKVAHSLNMGAKIMSGASPMIGGYAGPPEGAAVAGVAWSMSQYVVHLADYGGCAMMDIRYNGNTNREAIWALSVTMQALTRNTDLLIQSVSNQLGGPMTEMLLWESAAIMSALSVSGASVVIGPRSAGGKYSNHLSPLECRLCGEVLQAAAGLGRETVNEYVQEFVTRYADRLRDPEVGVPFAECYDLETLEPVDKWRRIYEEVKKELMNTGLPIQSRGGRPWADA